MLFVRIISNLVGDHAFFVESDSYPKEPYTQSPALSILLIFEGFAWCRTDRHYYSAEKMINDDFGQCCDKLGGDKYPVKYYHRRLITTHDVGHRALEGVGEVLIINTLKSSNKTNKRLKAVIDDIENGGYRQLMNLFVSRKIAGKSF